MSAIELLPGYVVELRNGEMGMVCSYETEGHPIDVTGFADLTKTLIPGVRSCNKSILFPDAKGNEEAMLLNTVCFDRCLRCRTMRRPEWDIVKVYGLSNSPEMALLCDVTSVKATRRLLWDESCIVKMTREQIFNALGREVRITGCPSCTQYRKERQHSPSFLSRLARAFNYRMPAPERPKEPPKEMTVDEIEMELGIGPMGGTLEIVKEENANA